MEWKDLPKEIQNRMLDCQVEQGNPRDVSVFEKNVYSGFIWCCTKEGFEYWDKILNVIPKKHISSYDDLIIGEYYWVFLDEKWNPTVAYAPFNPDNLYFRFLNGMHTSCKIVNIEHIEPLKHE